MWNSLANIKENLNQIVLEVQDATDGEEFEIYRSNSNSNSAAEDSPISNRRISHRFAQSNNSPLRSPMSNGGDSALKSEIEKYKTEIQKCQASEAEIKALSVNYAALLKEKEEKLSRLHGENEMLRKNLEAANALQHASKNETSNKRNVHKGVGEPSPNRQHKLTAHVNNHSVGNYTHKSVIKQDTFSNGNADTLRSVENLPRNENELADLLEEKNRSLAAIQANYDSEIKQLKTELSRERESSANIHSKFTEEQKLNGSFQKELLALKTQKNRDMTEMKQLQNQLNDKLSEIRRLQSELSRRDNEEETNEIIERLKRVIATLEQENTNLKIEKAELQAVVERSPKSLRADGDADNPDSSDSRPTKLNEAHSSVQFPEKEEMELSMQKLEKDLKEACRARDKVLQELTRLKQHLLDKELEESDKMDEDSKIIEDLRASCDYQSSKILRLEKALQQAITGQEEVKKNNNDELQKSKEMVNDLKEKLSSCMRTIDAKNVELMNLQGALGQYYAESEAKDRLEGDLALVREELARLSELLKDANQRIDTAKQEKDETLEKLSQTEMLLLEGKNRVHKLEEDNMKLRRALEQSMTRLNRMSVDSDFFVDRRIVIKLLVTYFQRNHSKEVLDLMVRMLGFSEDDKLRIGMAQQGVGKGVVRGVLGFPGRLVGGILGGTSSEASGPVPTDNQSFADLWVDFLLKETEERERRELMEAAANSKGDSPEEKKSSLAGKAGPVLDYRTKNPASSSSRSSSVNRPSSLSPLPSRGNLLQPENSDTEFSTVPLTTPVYQSPGNSSRISGFFQHTENGI